MRLRLLQKRQRHLRADENPSLLRQTYPPSILSEDQTTRIGHVFWFALVFRTFLWFPSASFGFHCIFWFSLVAAGFKWLPLKKSQEFFCDQA